jgi:hypothetical protein
MSPLRNFRLPRYVPNGAVVLARPEQELNWRAASESREQRHDSQRDSAMKARILIGSWAAILLSMTAQGGSQETARGDGMSEVIEARGSSALISAKPAAAWAEDALPAQPRERALRQECYTRDRSRPEWGPGASAIPEPGEAQPPVEFSLISAIPNPASRGATIRFMAPCSSQPAEVAIHDLQGRLLRILAVPLNVSGLQQVEWDACDRTGRRVPNGICFYTIRVGSEQAVGRIVMID